MPHVTIHYTPNLESKTSIGSLCTALADVVGAQRDASGARLFPLGGTRVLAYPAAHAAVADGAPDRVFVYINARIAAGRERARVQAAGEAMMDVVRRHFAELFERSAIGITLQIDEGAPVFDAKHSTLHPLFANA